MDALTNLGIDIKILLAQVFNFGILVGVLTFFLYKPVLKMLDERSKKIAESVKHAEEVEEMRNKAQEMFEEKIEEGKKEVSKMINSAKKDAEIMRKDIVEKANEKAKEVVDKAHLVIAQEKESLLADVKQEVVNLVIQTTGKILHDKDNVDEKTVDKILGNL